MANQVHVAQSDDAIDSRPQAPTSAGISAIQVAAVCDRIATLGTALLFLGIPLAFGGLYTFDMFDLPKAVYMRSISIIVLVAWAIGSMAKGELSWRKSLLDWPVLAYAIANILATLHTVSPTLSLHGEYRRLEGLYTILNYLLLFFFAANLFPWRHRMAGKEGCQESEGQAAATAPQMRDVRAMSIRELLGIILMKLSSGSVEPRGPTRLLGQDSFDILLTGQVVVGALIAVYGVAQHAGHDFVLYNPHGEAPVISTFGNMNFLAAYLIMVIPMGIGLLVLTPSLWKRVFLAVCLLPMTMTLFYATSRGAWLGLIASLTFMAILLGKRAILRNAPWIVILLALIVFPAIGNFGTLRARAENTFAEGATTVNYRLDWWRSILSLVADNPVLGTGVSTLEATFAKYASLDFARGDGKDTFLDKAHNEFLHLAATTGLVGLASYLWILVAAAGLVWALWRRWVTSGPSPPNLVVDQAQAIRGPAASVDSGLSEAQRMYVICLAAGIMAYLVQNQFSFGVIGTAAPFWMMLGLLVALARQGRIGDRLEDLAVRALPFKGAISQLLGLLVVLAGVVVFLLNARMLEADHLYRQARDEYNSGNYNAAVHLYLQILNLNPYQTEYWRGMGEAYADWGLTMKPQSSAEIETKNALLDRAVDAYKTAAAMNPAPYSWLFLAELYRRFDNDRGMVEAYQSYRKAVEVYRYYLYGNKGLGEMASKLHLYSEAQRAFELVTLIDPHDVDAYFNLALVYQYTGKDDEQISTWQKVLYLDPNRYAANYYLGNVYEKRGQKEVARTFYNKVLSFTPKPEQKEDYDKFKQQAQDALSRLDG